MAISVRVRFEVFKRDEFTCRYCGRRSPEVVLEVDHIVPSSRGGIDDPINLTTSCWDCNRGKRDIPLSEVMTGEDPHDRAVMLLERHRQLDEYNQVLSAERALRVNDTWALLEYWNVERGITGDAVRKATTREYRWMLNALTFCPREQVREFLDYALFRGFSDNLRYVMACVRNWRVEQPGLPPEATAQQPTTEPNDFDAEIDQYNRKAAAEEVLRLLREADFRRRNIGHCVHEPLCTTWLDCVQRYVRGWLELEQP